MFELYNMLKTKTIITSQTFTIKIVLMKWIRNLNIDIIWIMMNDLDFLCVIEIDNIEKIAQPINAMIMDKKYKFEVFISTTETKDLFYFFNVDEY